MVRCTRPPSTKSLCIVRYGHSASPVSDPTMLTMSLDALTTELHRIDRLRRADPIKAIEAVAGLAAQVEALIAALDLSQASQVANDNTADSVAPVVVERDGPD